jgi:segregation and condensation protein A
MTELFPTFNLTLEEFSGPLDKLLTLIEEKKLEITQINLAEVTVDFLNYIKPLGELASPQILADFLVIASRLVLIKSKVLLPEIQLSEEEERDIKDLETRLQLYRYFAAREGEASRYIRSQWSKNSIAYTRSFTFKESTLVFYPAKNVTHDSLFYSIKNVTALFEEIAKEPNKIKAVLISLEEKIREIVGRFKDAAAHSFRSLSQNKSKSEVVVLFLAVLHLLKDQQIKVAQEGQFGDILVEQNQE